MKKYITWIILTLIIVLAIALRFYKLGEAPSSVSWDEAAVGYNAWTILHYGKDEWGKTLPLVFKSFEDYKHPVHVYLTIPFIAIFGLNEVGVRASSAFFGVANVIVIFFLARKFFKSDLYGLIACFFLAISPYAIDFSRYNHELNFAIFFFLLGLFFLLKGIKEKNYFILLGFISFGIDILAYHSSMVVAPIIIFSTVLLFIKDLWKVKKWFFAGILAFGLFGSLFFVEPQLLGLARLSQTSSAKDRTFTSIKEKYLSHFTYNYLFVQGDSNPRLSSQTGEFYKIDILFLAVGIVALLFGIIKNKNREYLLILIWAVIAPLPAAVTEEAPHAARAMFMMGSFHLISALGAYTIITIFKNKYWRIFTSMLIVLASSFFLYKYLVNYYEKYTTQYAIEWQYGMKQIAEYVGKHPEYDAVYVTPERQEPYIFFLFYLRTPLPNYLSTKVENTTISRPANTIAGYLRYHFGLWEARESKPYPFVLYALTPAEFSGLRYMLSFDVVDQIKYPNGNDAFFLVTAKQR